MLQLLIYLRYLSVAGQMLTVVFVAQRLNLPIPARALLSISAGLLLFNVLSHWWWLAHREAGARALALQLLVDLLALTALLYFSGGPANPFVSLYLVPVALAAIGLDIAPMLGLTVLTAALYTWLMGHHVELPHLHGSDFQLHVTGMWVNFLLSAGIMAVVLSRFMTIVREQRRSLSEARERAIRDESLSALGSLAAGTAHELNTPLATMGLLVDDWMSGEHPPAREDLELLRSQLAHCRDHVRALAEMARRGAAGESSVEAGDAFVHACVDRWRLLRPNATARFRGGAAGRRVRVDPGLQQALINLINNAADANAAAGVDEPVEVETGMREGRLNIAIRDRGAGPARIARPRRDHPGSGLGIGLLISKSSIERSRGTVKQSERDGGGCVTEVELPLVAEGAA
ncbi:ATP-binding protein [Lysobacter enzymogenes]|uniref:ATP-binding protein n=1 Tax=Lysobacter enzymogenes TaxID=69 RepID=UPI00099DCEAB|nr:ATP-binding protein [Lysobacter enzymogenes]UZW58738.1 ATP-binding protein [Lysobacter enzymogenes]